MSYPVGDLEVSYWQIPAFRTAISTLGSVFSSSSTKALIISKLSISIFITLISADSNSSRIFRAAVSPFRTFRTPKITLALCFAYSLADWKPIPELAPVTRTVWPERSRSAGICGMVVVSCLRQKGTGPSEWNVKVCLLPKQNVADAKSDI